MNDPRETAKPRPGRRVRKDAAHDAPKRKINLVISEGAAKRFGVHALMLGRDRSEIVEEWIDAQCRRYVVQDRGGPPPSAGPARPDGREESEVELLPVGESLPADVGPHPPEGEGAPPLPAERRKRGQAAPAAGPG